ncbi:MAG: glycosyltransferase family 39 protein [Anaerolineae bacterium]|nr:glycosyltransferase family 39 protein [Anaerolineae bacterium]
MTHAVAFSRGERYLRGLALMAVVALAAAAQWVLNHRGLPSVLASWPGLSRLGMHPGLLGLALYALALAALMVLLSDPLIGVAGSGGRHAAWVDVLLVVGLLALAIWARLHQIDEIPPGLHAEETAVARRALEIVRGSWPLPWHMALPGVSWAYPYYMALFYKLFGPGYLAIKLPAIVGSALAVIPLYLLARETMRPAVAAAVTALYATSHWGIAIARWGQANALVPFFACLVLWLVWRGVHMGRRGYWIVGGIALGISQYTHPAARLIPVIVTLFILWRSLFPRGYLRRHWRLVALLYALALLVYLPLGWSSLSGPVPGGAAAATAGGSEVHVWHNVLAYVQAFHYRGDADPLNNLAGAPQLEGITAALLVIGMMGAIVWWRRPASALLLIWVGVYLIAGVFAPRAPDAFRTYGMLPALVLLAGVGLELLWSAWERIDPLSARSSGCDDIGSCGRLGRVGWRVNLFQPSGVAAGPLGRA